MTNENALEQAISTVAADPSRQAELEIALLAAELYVTPTDGPPPEGQVMGRDRPLTLEGLVLSDGQQATAAFTRREDAVPVFGAPASMGMRGRHLLEAFRTGWVVINPGHDQGLVLSPADIEAILKSAGEAQPLTESLDGDLAVPDPAPSLLVARLRTALEQPGIAAAWLARSTDRATGLKGWRLEVRANRRIDEVRALVGEAVAGLDFGGEGLELVIAPPTGADGPGLRVI